MGQIPSISLLSSNELVSVLFIHQSGVCKIAFPGQANLLKINLESKRYVD